MKKGDIRTIRLADGTTTEAEFIGKGMFCKAWRLVENGIRLPKVVCFVTGCYMKEAISGLELPHVPAIEKTGSDVGADGHDEYTMPWYRPLTTQNKEAWRQYRILQKLNEEAKAEVIAKYWKSGGARFWSNYGIVAAQSFTEKVSASEELPGTLKEAIETIYSNISNYGSGCAFEFSVRNLAVDEAGVLILLDVAFDSEKVRR